METRKLTEGALLSALQIVLGLILLSTGIGYSFYLELLLPIMMTVIYLRCGSKIGFLAGLNTVILIAFCFGDIVGAVYMAQALGFGFLCGWLLQRKGTFQDDLMIASLIGCIFLLILDVLTAGIVGYSLLDTDGLEEIFAFWIPEGNEVMFQVLFYISIAAIPIASVLMAYVGGLVLGYKMRILPAVALEKYRVIRHFKIVLPHTYHTQKATQWALIGIVASYLVWPFLKGGYSKALIATSGVVLLYFVLTDYMKLIAQYLVDKGNLPIVVSLLHFGALIALVNAFITTCCIVLALGLWVDAKTQTRKKEAQILNTYLKNLNRLKQAPALSVRRA